MDLFPFALDHFVKGSDKQYVAGLIKRKIIQKEKGG